MTEPTSKPDASPPGDLGFALPEPAGVSGRKALLLSVVATGLLGAAFLAAYLPRHSAQRELQAAASSAESALASVTVSKPKLVANERALRLPASIQPLEEAALYARANGYVSRWLVDLGAKVKEGELLAEIDAPELIKEIGQARAALARAQASKLQSEAGRDLAKSQLDRAGKLVEAGIAPQQQLEQSQAQSAVGNADVQAADAMIDAERSNVGRLSDLRQFTRLTAPFDGVITQRNIERGSLVAAGTGTPLFRIAATQVVRVYVKVPQDIAPSVTVGSKAKVTIREYPRRTFEGLVANTAGVLDSTTRTLNTEIRVDNADGALLSGMYAEVQLNLATARQVYELPATALLSDAQGLRVAVVKPDDTLELRPIVLERDLGATLYVSNGVAADERIVQIARADLQQGQRVRAVQAKVAPSSSASAAVPVNAQAPAPASSK